MHARPTRRAGRAVRLAIPAVVVLLAVAGALSACAPNADIRPASVDTSVTVITTPAPVPVLSPASLSPTSAPSKPGYKLVFDDEFTGRSLDTTRWATSLPWGNTNRAELQYYTPRNLSQKGGLLKITARQQAVRGKPYTSGVISSFNRFAFTYGYAEIRVQVPAGTGLWPAFWLPTTVRGLNDEIDIMELLGSDPSLGNAVLHYGTTANKGMSNGTYRDPDFSIGFHTFAIDWQPGLIVWYVDGVERRRVDANVPSHPMYMIASLTVGGPTSWSGAPDRYTAFPADMTVDYIRVYQPH